VAALVSRSEAKIHCRVDGTLEDSYIDALILAAEGYVSQYLNRPLVPWTEDSPVEDAPAEVKQAILLVIADLYQNREAQMDKQLYANAAVQNLLHFHRLDIGV
jgi:uncharacterized phage protein (predicted DNA packaging)